LNQLIEVKCEKIPQLSFGSVRKPSAAKEGCAVESSATEVGGTRQASLFFIGHYYTHYFTFVNVKAEVLHIIMHQRKGPKPWFRGEKTSPVMAGHSRKLCAFAGLREPLFWKGKCSRKGAKTQSIAEQTVYEKPRELRPGFKTSIFRFFAVFGE